MYSYILSCKIKIETIFYTGVEKSDIKNKDFDQGTVAIQFPSFSTSKASSASYFSAKISISKTPLRSQIGYKLYHNGPYA